VLADAAFAGGFGAAVSFSVAALADPGVVHFYSYSTGVSIELPTGFESDGGDATSARYRDGAAVVQVRVVGEADSPGAAAAALAALADGFAGRAELVSRRDRVVDDCPAVTVVTRSAAGVEQQTVLAADERLITVVGTGLEPPDGYDAAIESIRVIPL
jgi:hypothetical protein